MDDEARRAKQNAAAIKVVRCAQLLYEMVQPYAGAPRWEHLDAVGKDLWLMRCRALLIN